MCTLALDYFGLNSINFFLFVCDFEWKKIVVIELCRGELKSYNSKARKRKQERNLECVQSASDEPESELEVGGR